MLRATQPQAGIRYALHNVALQVASSSFRWISWGDKFQPRRRFPADVSALVHRYADTFRSFKHRRASVAVPRSPSTSLNEHQDVHRACHVNVVVSTNSDALAIPFRESKDAQLRRESHLGVVRG